jgi:riboflavin kinase/FMN adenylyltransferase
MSRGASVVTIGNFDGVHAGHGALVRAAAEMAKTRGATALALVFDPHPSVVLSPAGEAGAPARIMPFAARERALRSLGADGVIRLEPTRALLSQAPEAFVDEVIRVHGAVGFVEGTDFCFGKGRAGTVETLCLLGKARGVEVRVVQPVEVVLSDHQAVRVSSTLCRWLLKQGRVDDFRRATGRSHALEGDVIRGDRRGRGIGFPTANLQTADLLPGDGVYAARAVLPGTEDVFAAAVNVGERPTIAGATRTVEAHLIGVAGASPTDAWAPLPGLPEYGWPLRLELVAWLRDQFRFDGLDSLKAQLGRDCLRAVEVVGRSSRLPVEPAVLEGAAL